MTPQQFASLDAYTRANLYPKPITTPAFLTLAHKRAQARVHEQKQAAMRDAFERPGVFASQLCEISWQPEERRPRDPSRRPSRAPVRNVRPSVATLKKAA
jgi:hypothetical protein